MSPAIGHRRTASLRGRLGSALRWLHPGDGWLGRTRCQHPQPGSADSLALPPCHTGPPHPRPWPGPACPRTSSRSILGCTRSGALSPQALFFVTLRLPFGKASRAPRPNYPKRTVCGGIRLMDLPRTPHIQPTHCHWNRPKATSCYNLPITICMSMSAPHTQGTFS